MSEEAKSVRFKILEIIREDFEFIKPSNKYSKLLSNIEVGKINGRTDISYPSIYFHLGQDVLIKKDNHVTELREVEVLIGVYVDAMLDTGGYGNLIFEAERMINDLTRHFYGDVSIAQEFHSRLQNKSVIPEIIWLEINRIDTVPDNETTGRVGMVLKIRYKQNTNLTPLNTQAQSN